jgi:hypothetical protein
MGMMDMLNPVKAAKKVGQQVQKLPGVQKMNGMAQGAANAAQKFAPPGMKGIGPSFSQMQPMGIGQGMNQSMPQMGGMMGKFGGMMKQQPPMMGQQPIDPIMPVTPMPDLPVGNTEAMGQGDQAGIQQWLQRMKMKNTGINGGRSMGPIQF